MIMNIVVLDGYTLNPGDLSWEELEALGTVTLFNRTEKDTESIIQAVGDAEIVLTNKVPFDKATLDALPNLKYIGVLATGFNIIDTDYAKEKGIIVTNIPSYATQATAQFTMALLLELCHRVGEHSRSVHNGDWVKSIDFCYWNHPLMELSGKTLGIIGFGRIGQTVAKMAQAFGMKVLFYSRTPKPQLENETCKMVAFDELLTHSDVISLHCPLTSETQGIINKESIAKMKNGVFLLNTGRGPLINEMDVAEAMENGKIAGAAMDVLSTEPMVENHPFMGAKNCIITPHIAWAATETRQRLMDIALENIKAFLKNQPINIVNG